MTNHADLFAGAEMRWMSVEDAEITVRARVVAEIGREMAALEAKVDEALALVREQAEDELLWVLHFEGQQPIVEAYLQQELRRLHAVIEGDESVSAAAQKLERLRADVERLARWAGEQNAGNAFAAQVQACAEGRLAEWDLPIEEWEP